MFSCSSAGVSKTNTSRLVGTWDWVSSCGGFTGGCWYPSAQDVESVEFKTDWTYIKKVNDSIVLESKYIVDESRINGADVIYTIEFENRIKMPFRVIKDTLSIQGGDFWKNYKKKQ